MFEVPEAKRVRRSELRSSSRSASLGSGDDEATNAAAHAALASFFSSRFEIEEDEKPRDQLKAQTRIKAASGKALPSKTKPARQPAAQVTATSIPLPSSPSSSRATSPIETQDATSEREEPPSYSFRLFSGPDPSSTSNGASGPGSTAQIVLGQDDMAAEPAPHQRRPRSYYVAPPWTESERAARAPLALTADDIQAESARRWPGMAVPWRVSTIRVGRKGLAKLATWAKTGDGGKAAEGGETDGKAEAAITGILLGPDGEPVREDGRLTGSGKRRRRGGRPGVKRRRVLKMRVQKAADDEQARVDNRNRRNREKKMRKRAKARDEKATATGATMTAAEDVMDGAE